MLEARGIDNVNLFNGDPGLVIPLGPEYTLAPSYTWQLRAYYSAKIWTMSSCDSDGTRFAWVRGDPTLGVGWNLQLGYVVSTYVGLEYHSPDGGRHLGTVLLEANRWRTADGTRLRITAIPNASSPTSYTVEFPDGTLETFAQIFSPPRPTSGASPDFTNLAYGAPAETRFGLTRVEDRFRNVVMQVNYGGAYPWEVTGVVLTPNTQPRTVNFFWKAGGYTVGSVTWQVLDYIDFPASSSSIRRVAFRYQDATFVRNDYDISNNFGSLCPPASPPVQIPQLASIIFTDPAASFSYSYTFNYFTAPSPDPIPVQKQGALKSVALPTGGTIAYDYGQTTQGACQIQAGCDPESSGRLAAPAPDPPSYFPRFLAFLDKSIAVTSRTEFDPVSGVSGVTSYDRQQYWPYCAACNGGDPGRVLRRTTVTAPGNDVVRPVQYAKRYYFHVGFLYDDGSEFEGGGIELERRYYPDSVTTVTPVRSIISCWQRTSPTDPVKCGYHDAAGALQTFNFSDLPPKHSEVTWYGATPAGTDGGTCPSGSTPCTATVSTDYDPIAGKYKAAEVKTTLPAMDGWLSRISRTEWNPQTNGVWLLDLFTAKSATDTGSNLPAPAYVSSSYNFNLSNGFLNSVATSDSYGSLTQSFSPDGLGNPLSENRFGGGGVSGTQFTDYRTFQSGLQLTSQRSGIGWKSFDVDRDTNSGAITLSRDPNFSTQDSGHYALRTTYGYDALGRLTLISPQWGEAGTSIAYDSATQTTVLRSGAEDSTFQRYLYDGLGRLVREIRGIPGGYATRTRAYDQAGHAYFLSEWASCGNPDSDCRLTNAPGTTSSSFDPFGRPELITKADGTQTTVSHLDDEVSPSIQFSDSLERVTVTVSGSAATTATRRDALGRIISVKEPAIGGVSDETRYQYNVLDKLAKVTQGPQLRTFDYDSFGFLRSETTPEKNTVNYSSYDALGDLLTEDLPPQFSVNRTYDPAGRLTLVTTTEVGSPTYVSNTYDQNPQLNFSLGRLTTRFGYNPSLGSSVSDVFVYSGLGGRLSARDTGIAGLTAHQSWFYNSFGLVSHHYHPRLNGQPPFVVSTNYSRGLPVTEYVNGIKMIKAVTYHPGGALASYTTGAGIAGDTTTQISQDINTRMPRPSQIRATAQAGAALFDTGTYIYDGAGNITNLQGAATDTFTYDARSRLCSASLAGLGSQWFGYDRFGNLIAKQGSFTPCASASVWSNNRLPGATYDGRGNLLAYGADSYNYDGLDRMTRHTSTGFTYLYDGANERIGKSDPTNSWTYTFRDEADRIAAEFAGSAQSRDNVFLGSLVVASYSNAAVGPPGSNGPVWTFYSADHLGTPRLLTRIDGSTFETRKYFPYGDEAIPSTIQRLRFASMERDTEASRYYDHARSHDFNLGRFLSPDKLGGKPRDPQSWNRYVYARDNPVKLVDPNGLCSAPAGVGNGNVGVCIEAFIAASRIKGGIALGDARGFSGTDPGLTSRVQIQFLVNAQSGRISNQTVTTGTSYVLFKSPMTGSEGTTVASVASVPTGNGSSVSVGAYSWNGFTGMPGAPLSPIQFNVGLDVDSSGKVTADPNATQAKTYPSFAGYAYGPDGSVTTLFEQSENKIGDLNKPMQSLKPQSFGPCADDTKVGPCP